jgi:hypothetical protein
MFPRTVLALTLFALLTACHAADKKDEHPVEPAKLAALIKQADKIVVSDNGVR